jgi:predicted TIM-barrel fold metal-dependent hydrolase
MSAHTTLSRRQFLAGSAALFLAPRLGGTAAAAPNPEPIIDIHQHTNYHGRSDQQMIAHQRAMGITTTMLLPAGRPISTPTTHEGRSNGLAAGTGGNETVLAIARDYPGEFFFFANEVPDLPEARKELEKYLKLGAKGIGEQKFDVPCDSPHVHLMAEVAQEYEVPVLLHFQEGRYNRGLERFHKVLEKFPRVNFIGHAQTWWGNIDKQHDQKVLYPTGPVTPGGITDQLLSNYPNMFADHSAGSGLNALLRDEDHARWFIEKHQNQLLYGSDCTDTLGRGPGCQGAQTLAAIRRLSPRRAVERKILFENSRRLFKLAS